MLKASLNSIKIGLFIAVINFISCGRAATFDSSVSNEYQVSADSVYEEAVGGSLSFLSLEEGSLQINVSDLSHDVVIALHSFDEGSGNHAFEINTAGSTKNLERYTLSQTEDDSTQDETQSDITESFHHSLRDLESQIEEGQSLNSDSMRFAKANLNADGVREFKVLSSFSDNNGYTVVTARLKYETANFQFYIDVRDESSISASNLAKLASDFESVISKEREVFGSESDVDGDGKFAVLFTQEINKLGARQGGVITGYFYALDLFESSKYPLSNEMEIIYTFVPDPKGLYGSSVSESFAVSNIIKGVLPHEFQHMINFNQHYFLDQGSAEKSWLNEGLSHLAEDFYTLDEEGMIQGFGLENPARVSNYLADISNVCFTCGSSLSERGGSYLFLKYLFEQAELLNLPDVSSGVELLQKLLSSKENGISNIVNAVFGEGSPDEDFKELLADFSLAVYLSNTNQIGNDMYEFTAIDLRGLSQDNRGTYLNGPSVQMISSFPYTDTIKGSGLTYIQISKEMLAQSNGQLTLTTDGMSDFGGYLIQ